MCVGSEGHPGTEGPPGPPTLETLIRMWIEEDPTLKRHLYVNDQFTEGMYIETKCPQNRIADWGYGLALIPYWRDPESRVILYYHGSKRSAKSLQFQEGGTKIKGYLRKEDPQFLQKLRDHLVRGHDVLYDRTECRIKWKYGDLLPDYEAYDRQTWWADGKEM